MDCFSCVFAPDLPIYENGVYTDYKTVMEVTPKSECWGCATWKGPDASRIAQPSRVPLLPSASARPSSGCARPSRVGPASPASGCNPFQRQLDLFQVMLVMPGDLVEFGFQCAHAGFTVHILEMSIRLVVQPRV